MAFATSSKDLGCGPTGTMGAPSTAELEAAAIVGEEWTTALVVIAFLQGRGLGSVDATGTEQSKQGASLDSAGATHKYARLAGRPAPQMHR